MMRHIPVGEHCPARDCAEGGRPRGRLLEPPPTFTFGNAAVLEPDFLVCGVAPGPLLIIVRVPAIVLLKPLQRMRLRGVSAEDGKESLGLYFFFFKSTCSQQRGIGRSPFPIRRVRFCRPDAFGLHAVSVCSNFPIALLISCFNTVAKIILPLLLYRQIHLRSRAEVFLCTASGDRKASKACQALGSFQTPALASRPPLCKDNIRSHRVARGNDAPGLRRSPALHSLTPS